MEATIYDEDELMITTLKLWIIANEAFLALMLLR